MQGATTEIGKTITAGLPNITSTSRTYTDILVWSGGDSARQFGAFNIGDPVTYRPNSGGNGFFCPLSFDASKSNALYGASTTVQPPSLRLAVLIKHD